MLDTIKAPKTDRVGVILNLMSMLSHDEMENLLLRWTTGMVEEWDIDLDALAEATKAMPFAGEELVIAARTAYRMGDTES